jgi:hypothetical protein
LDIGGRYAIRILKMSAAVRVDAHIAGQAAAWSAHDMGKGRHARSGAPLRHHCNTKVISSASLIPTPRVWGDTRFGGFNKV